MQATNTPPAPFVYGRQRLYNADCIEWLAAIEPASIAAVITDPPYGLVEYAPEQQHKLRAGRGGVWRIPPSFDGARRRALPRFTVLSTTERKAIFTFFLSWASALRAALLPGAHVFVAANVLVSPLVACGIEDAGLERRGEIARLVRTFRGGDRPKGAEAEFPLVSTMPRSCWEPWLVYRNPIATKTVAENLRLHKVGALRRRSEATPFLDVIESGTASDAERAISDHPSLKPQSFLRQIVRAALPFAEGSVLDPFAGSGSTLAACEALGVNGIGVEKDERYFITASDAIPKLARLSPPS